MMASLLLCFLALRAGLRLRRERERERERERGGRERGALRRNHLGLAKPGVVMALAGFLGGPLSMVFLRGRDPLGTAHALAGTAAAALLVAAALLGRRIETGRSRRLDVHTVLGLLALGVAALSALTGLVLLP